MKNTVISIHNKEGFDPKLLTEIFNEDSLQIFTDDSNFEVKITKGYSKSYKLFYLFLLVVPSLLMIYLMQ